MGESSTVMDSNDGGEYDYIICGGGTAGCVIAARLAENTNVSILLLESGVSKVDVPLSSMPAAVFEILGSKDDWNIQNESGGVFGERKIDLHRPKFISGSSGANGTLCIRGTRHDFDDWGVDGWSGDDMFRYMSKAECFKGAAWFKADEASHGREGPIITAPHVNAPISDLMLESFQSAGLPLVPDMFTTGNVAHGCGHAIRTIYRGVRSTAADYLEAVHAKAKITIETLAFVDSLDFDGAVAVGGSGSNGQLSARGVHVAKVLPSGAVERKSFRARREIILCGGAYGSPALLLRSGIGPAAELKRLGIPCAVAREGVGMNLQDHLINLTHYEVSEPQLTTDHLLWHGDAGAQSIEQWQKDRTGFMGQFPFGAFAYARLDDRLKDEPMWQQAKQNNPTTNHERDALGMHYGQPHVEFWNTECYNPKYQSGEALGSGKSAFAMVTELFAQRSRGRVSLRSRDPLDKPMVDHNYLSDPLDMLVFSEACRLGDEIVRKGAGTARVVSGTVSAARGGRSPETREQWAEEIRAHADTCFHPAGTCRMGHAGNPDSVVDEQLRLLGVRGVRIADASIIPSLPCGHTQMTVYAIAEKAADMIKASAKGTFGH